MDLSSLTVVELKKQLGLRALKVSGPKKDLVLRLHISIEEENKTVKRKNRGWKDFEIEYLLKMNNENKDIKTMAKELNRTESAIRQKLAKQLNKKKKTIFNGYKFAVSGSFSKSQKEIKELITEYGGIINASVTKQVHFLVVGANGFDDDSLKYTVAKQLKVYIIYENYLHDCIGKNKMLNLNNYIVQQNDLATTEDDIDDDSDSDDKIKGIFNDYCFVIAGNFSKLQKEIKESIIKYGGIVNRSVTKEANFLLVGTNNIDLSGTKCVLAKKLKVPIVIENYLHDCIGKNKILNWNNYIVEENDNNNNNDEKKSKKKISTCTENSNNNRVDVRPIININVSNKRKNISDYYDDDYSDDEPPKKKQKSKSKLDWDEDECSKWIASLGKDYKQYANGFKSAGITGDFLDDLDDDTLSDIVKNKLHRKRIMHAWNKIKL